MCKYCQEKHEYYREEVGYCLLERRLKRYFKRIERHSEESIKQTNNYLKNLYSKYWKEPLMKAMISDAIY